MMPATPVEFEPYFGGFILETLTVGMYGEARNAIREYIQNGFDSIQRAIDEAKVLPAGGGLIEIELSADNKSLVIRDNGAGLSVKSATATLTRVGASTKNHTRNAGFRGIGRLAGIVFSDKVTFVTKAKGEREQTFVVFNAKAMRDAMSPARGNAKSAQELMKDFVRARREPHATAAAHFFEVRLEGLVEPPNECISAAEMIDFVSQVAPVPYPEDFPFRRKLVQAAERNGIPVEEVKITVRQGRSATKEVTKRYGKTYEFEAGDVTLAPSDCLIRVSPTKRWWAWVGLKTESGAYTDSRVRGLRVRVRNIQIDGAEIVREIFRTNAKSHERFQDYFLGEIFVKPGALVPNARRDGFEEDTAWRRTRDEIAVVAKELGKIAYDTSTAGQLSLEAQKGNLTKARGEIRKQRKAAFADVDAALKLSTNITTFQKRIAKASQGADMPTSAELQAIGAELTDIKREALTHIGTRAAEIDREKVELGARAELLAEIMAALEQDLSPKCFAEVQDILADYRED